MKDHRTGEIMNKGAGSFVDIKEKPVLLTSVTNIIIRLVNTFYPYSGVDPLASDA